MIVLWCGSCHIAEQMVVAGDADSKSGDMRGVGWSLQSQRWVQEPPQAH